MSEVKPDSQSMDDVEPARQENPEGPWRDILTAQDEVSLLLTGQRAFLVNKCAPVFALVGATQLFVYKFLGFELPVSTQVIAIAVIAVLFLAPFIYRISRSFIPVSIIVNSSIGISLYVFAWTTSGIHSATVILLVQLPIFVTFLTGIRSGLFTLGAIIPGMIALTVHTIQMPDVSQADKNLGVMICLLGTTASIVVFLLVGLIWHAVVVTLKKLGETTRELELSNRTKSVFLANMSHELRTPLNGIIGMSDLISRLSEKHEATDRSGEYAGYIHQSGRHLLLLVNKLLDFTGLMSSEIKLDLEDLRASDLVEFSMHSVGSLLQEKSQAIDYTPPAPGTDKLQGDGTRIRQVLLNLIGNAIKYSAAGTQIEVELTRNEIDQIEIHMTNFGPGLSAGDIALAFEPFGRVEADDTSASVKREEGLGLGLPISRRIAEAHGGSLRLVSTPGVSTTAILSLPCAV